MHFTMESVSAATNNETEIVQNEVFSFIFYSFVLVYENRKWLSLCGFKAVFHNNCGKCFYLGKTFHSETIFIFKENYPH